MVGEPNDFPRGKSERQIRLRRHEQLIDLLKQLTPSPIKRLVIPYLPLGLRARSYVGTDEVSGQLQLELLKRQGCRPNSKVLEIGCGRLHAGIPLMQYLDKGNYVGVDPNEWLRQTAMKNRYVREVVEEKQPRFLSVDDFDASALGIKFDFVLSHSVLSHCAHWQLEKFLRNAGKVLAPGGRILASIFLAEGNAYGSRGTPGKEDSMHQEWQYPGVSFFKLSTVMKTAHMLGLTAVRIPEYTEFYTKTRPKERHDWLLFCWKP
jgi:cyclopropane fatty-acyl-phospholipid synthase-like methyltransferase